MLRAVSEAIVKLLYGTYAIRVSLLVTKTVVLVTPKGTLDVFVRITTQGKITDLRDSK